MCMQSTVNGSVKTAQLTVPSRLQYFASIRQLISDFVQDSPLRQEDARDFALAAAEAVTNSIKHSRSRDLTITLDKGEDSVTIKVTDQGRGFKVHQGKYDFPSPEVQGGRGIPLMRNLTDFLEIKSQRGRGTEVILMKRLKKSGIAS
ncbi:MAG: ATP-binding protein [Actinobacteria bacterium]|nr:ATP-binding protein [Actinomycetota bacterium]